MGVVCRENFWGNPNNCGLRDGEGFGEDDISAGLAEMSRSLPGTGKSRRHGGRHHRQSMFPGKHAARDTQRGSILVRPRVGCVWKGSEAWESNRREVSWDKCRIVYVLTSGRGLSVLMSLMGGQSGCPGVFSLLPGVRSDLEVFLHSLPSFALTSFSSSDHQAPSRYMLFSSLFFSRTFQSFRECRDITDTCLFLTQFLWVPKPRREHWAWRKAFLVGAWCSGRDPYQGPNMPVPHPPCSIRSSRATVSTEKTLSLWT